MPKYISPGVYIEEVSIGIKPIEGVTTSTAGMVGMTEKGTTIKKPILVTSFAHFNRKFGSYLGSNFGKHRFLAYAVKGFFQNGGKSIYIISVKGDGRELSDREVFIGIDNGPGHRTALQALRDIDQINILAIPGITDVEVQRAMLQQCEILKDRFAILDIPEEYRSISDVLAHRQNFDSKYGAIYHPWLKLLDPLVKRDSYIPPSGHIAGIYARTDTESGVHKAPANAIVRGIKGLKYGISDNENELLNSFPNNINALRDFNTFGRGIRVWGARCITSDQEWKYINIRRLFLFIEESIEEGIKWVVFEPNNESTWVKVRRSVNNFLSNLWRAGALQGINPDEAFFVKCDGTTMTQDDIDNGKLIVLIGFAAVRPAEFVIFRIEQLVKQFGD